MTKEEKDLLLKDLCARMPYGVKVQFKTNSVIENKYKFIYNVDGEYEYINIGKSNLTLDIIKMLSNNCIDEIKPYLFPLSSMTEEQKNEYHELIGGMFQTNALINFEILEEFFHKNHFDYRGLISKGLAIDCTNLDIY